MIERLPTPWGLVRLGVAPDHPKLKAVSRAFEKIAAQPRLPLLRQRRGRARRHARRPRPALRRGHLHGRRADRPAARDPRRGPPRLVGRHGVRRLVQRPPRLPAARLRPLAAERAVVVGNGNVALDVARMLALTPEELAPTDATDAVDRGDRGLGDPRDRGARPARARSRRRSRRRSSTRSGDLAGADVVVDPAELELDPASEAELAEASNIVKRNMEILREFAAREPDGQAATLVLRFRVSRRSRSSATSASRGSRSSATSSSRTATGACAPRRPTSARRSRASSCSAASATAGCRVPGCRSTRRAARCRTRAAACSATTEPRSRRLLRRLDQARPERRHRHEQEGRDGDGRGAARWTPRPAGSAASGAGRGRRGAARRARRRRRRVRGLGGDRRSGARRGRAARPSAGQAHELGRRCSTPPARQVARPPRSHLWTHWHTIGTPQCQALWVADVARLAAWP